MKICECGSFAINDDPDGVLCDKCLLQDEIDKLRQVLEEYKRSSPRQGRRTRGLKTTSVTLTPIIVIAIKLEG